MNRFAIALAKAVVPSLLWSKLLLIRQRVAIWRFRPHIVHHQYGDQALDVYLADPMGQEWYDRDWPQMPEIDFLRRHQLQPGATVFDLGAHQGVVALVLAKLAGPTGKVVAVEGNGHNAQVALRNRDLNTAPQLEVRHAVVAEAGGALPFSQGYVGQVDRPRRFLRSPLVPAVTIDDLSQHYGWPQVLYLDLEGYECRALQGARRTLQHRPDCFVEVHLGHGLEKFGGSLQVLLDFFPQGEFQTFAFSEAQPQIVPFSPALDFVRARFFLIAIAA
jgi:FkbM family methyltransferase